MGRKETVMKIGIYAPLTAQSEHVATLARELEARGFDSIWVPEHTHIPTTGSTPYPGRGPVTREFAQTLDPFVTLATAAAVTENLGLGTGVCLLIQRDTITTAKSVATLDHLSGGRVLFGVGGGWNRPEMENHGTEYATRFKKLEEQLEATKRIWTEDEAEFHGRYVDFDPIWCWPKPATRPHPPILLGGETEYTLRRIVAHADGWLPRNRDPERVVAGIARLRELAREAGRDEDSLSINVFGVRGRPEDVKQLRDLGVERVIVTLADGGAEDTSRRLDRYAELLDL
jgi:probable F420-dependent oxidoreductase